MIRYLVSMKCSCSAICNAAWTDVAGVLCPSSVAWSSMFVVSSSALGLAAVVGVVLGGVVVVVLVLVCVVIGAALCPTFIFPGAGLSAGAFRN